MHRKGPGSVASSRRGAKVEGKKHKLRVAFLHPDLGLGGAERLILDAVLELRARGHDVVLYTAHHDVTHCFSETLVDGARAPWLRVYGDWLPRSVRGRGHAACAILRCLFLALCLLATVSRRQHAIVVDQVSAPLLLLRFLCRSKARANSGIRAAGFRLPHLPPPRLARSCCSTATSRTCCWRRQGGRRCERRTERRSMRWKSAPRAWRTRCW